MQASKIQANQRVTLAAGGTTTVTHGLHDTAGNGYTPNRVLPNEATPIVVVSVSSTEVVFRNDGYNVESADFQIQYDHSIQQAADPLSTLLWNGLGSGVGGLKVFRYTSAGGSSDFMVTILPSAMASDDYGVFPSQVNVAAIVGLQFPDALAGDRTTTQFRVVSSAPLVAGDSIDFLIIPR